MAKNDIDRINIKTMRSSVNHYSENHKLNAPERAALEYVAHVAKDKSILDIGVGGGRTVPALLKISNNYTGVDYVREMVEECQKKYPDVSFSQGDARNMSAFADESVFLAVFSMNGISMVDHLGRLEIIKEVYRALEPGGLFLFSTYNKDNPDYKKLLRLPKFRKTINPFRLGVRCAKYGVKLLLMIRNRRRFRRHEQHTDEYSIVNDRCHNYSTMLYYISRDSQCEQLLSEGFHSEIMAFDLQGNQVGDDGTFDNSIFYIARKPE